MGFFKSVNQVTQQGREMSDNYDAKAAMADASARMSQGSAMMAGASPLLLQAVQENIDAQAALGGTPATATITAVRDTGIRQGVDAVLSVDLLIAGGGAPYPVSRLDIVRGAVAPNVVAGATVRVTTAPSNPTLVWIEWGSIA